MIILLCLIFMVASTASFSQEHSHTLDKLTTFPSLFFDKLQKKTDDLEEKLISNTEKILKNLANQEACLKKKLAKKGSLHAEQIKQYLRERRQLLREQLDRFGRSKIIKKTKLPLLWHNPIQLYTIILVPSDYSAGA